MLKAREILRLKHEVQLSLRDIGQACNCGKTTVAEVLGRAEKAGIMWLIVLSDKQLMSMLYPPLDSKNSPPEPDMEYVFHEMKKKSIKQSWVFCAVGQHSADHIQVESMLIF